MKVLIAQKAFRYGGVLLHRGDVFTAKDKVFKVLKATGRAKEAPPPPADLAPLDEPRTNERAKLREEYMRLAGKRPFNGWDEDKLREKMEPYLRRDMRAAQ